jgi:hypothetical protein
MNSAANCQTIRRENIAYSFKVLEYTTSIFPLFTEKALELPCDYKKEKPKQTDDHRLFAWRASASLQIQNPVRGLFASSPNEFRNFLREPRNSSSG